MRILQLHNYYQQAGGEDAVVAAEKELLTRHGHEVELLAAHNDSIDSFGKEVLAGLNTIYSRKSHAMVRQGIRRFKPDIVHVHNFLPMLSPSVYYAAQSEGVPVVQTLHNYRLMCPSAVLMRQGSICEECVGKVFPMPAIKHACYRGSRGASAAVAAMLGTHRIIGSWERAVDRYIVLTEFGRQKFIQCGLPADKIWVKPNFLLDPPLPGNGQGGYAIFVGRLSEEKGIRTLLKAWSGGQIPFPLKMVGDGPLVDEVRSASAANRNIQCLGRKPGSEIYELMRAAAFLVFPSEWYEGMPLVLVESFACGTPVIAAKLGAGAELVKELCTGLHFQPGNSDSLISVLLQLLAQPLMMRTIRTRVRAEFEARYAAEQNLDMLIKIYSAAKANRSRK